MTIFCIIMSILSIGMAVLSYKEMKKEAAKEKPSMNWLNINKRNIKVWCISLAFFLFLDILLAYGHFSGDSNSYTSNHKTTHKIECEACGREFDYGTDDSKSIRKRNLCTKCYESYSWAKSQGLVK